MGGVAGALDRMRVNLTLEVEGGMWMHAEPRCGHCTHGVLAVGWQGVLGHTGSLS